METKTLLWTRKICVHTPADEGAIFKIEDLIVPEAGYLEAEFFLSRCRYDVLRLGIALVDIAIVSDDAYGT